MKPLVRSAAALAAALTISCAPKPADPLAVLIDQHTEARGGAAAIEAIKTVRTKVEIVEPTFQVTGDYRAMEGRMRIDVYADGQRVFSEGVGDEGAWQQSGADAPVSEASEAGKAALLHGIEFNLFGLHQLAGRGNTLSLEENEVIDGVAFQVIKVVMADGFETYLYINPDTSMIERRRDIRALHPDADPATKLIENQYADFRKSCGVMNSFASRQVDVRTGEELQTTRIVEQRCNLGDQALEIPRSIVVD